MNKYIVNIKSLDGYSEVRIFRAKDNIDLENKVREFTKYSLLNLDGFRYSLLDDFIRSGDLIGTYVEY